MDGITLCIFSYNLTQKKIDKAAESMDYFAENLSPQLGTARTKPVLQKWLA